MPQSHLEQNTVRSSEQSVVYWEKMIVRVQAGHRHIGQRMSMTASDPRRARERMALLLVPLRLEFH